MTSYILLLPKASLAKTIIYDLASFSNLFLINSYPTIFVWHTIQIWGAEHCFLYRLGPFCSVVNGINIYLFWGGEFGFPQTKKMNIVCSNAWIYITMQRLSSFQAQIAILFLKLFNFKCCKLSWWIQNWFITTFCNKYCIFISFYYFLFYYGFFGYGSI